ADYQVLFFFFSSRRRHTISKRDWSSDVCSSDLLPTSNCSTDVLRLRDHRKRQELNRSRNGPSTFSIHARRNVRTKCAHLPSPIRSEERRVGKECSDQWWRRYRRRKRESRTE